jgi:hypothetical protein
MKLLKIFFIISALYGNTLALAAGNCSYPNDPQLQQEKTTCDANSGTDWNCELNRCVTTEKSVEERAEFQACANIADEGQRRACHDNLAEKNSGELSELEESFLGLGVAGALATLAAFAHFSQGSGKSSCTSATIFKLTSLGHLASELYFKFMLEGELEELQESYKEEATDTDPFKAQLRSFEYLKEEQELIVEIAGQKKMIYYTLAAGYGVAGIWAAVDMAQGPCTETGGATETPGEVTPAPPAPPTTSSIFTTPFQEINFTPINPMEILFPSAHALDFGGIGKMLSSPQGIMILSAVGAGASFFLAQGAAEQEEESQKNVEKLEEIIANFRTLAQGLCSPKSREDLEKPDCFCFSEDGTRNPARTQSAICQQLFSELDKNLFVGATDFSKGLDLGPKVCVDSRNRVDRECKCRKIKDRNTGENACLKGAISSANISGISSALDTQGVISNLNGLTQSDFSSFGNLTGNAAGARAAKINKGFRQIAQQVNKKLKAQGKSPVSLKSDNLKGLANKIVSSQKLQTPGSGNLASALKNSRKALGSNIGERLKKAEQEFKKRGSSYSGGKGDNKNKKSKKKRSSFFIDQGSGNSKVLNLSDKNYDFKDNDIVKREDVSIWEVISHRYNASGLKRLFNDD